MIHRLRVRVSSSRRRSPGKGKMEDSNPLLALSPKAVKMAKALTWAAATAFFLHIAGAFFINPVTFLERGHGSPGGIGIIIDDVKPLISSTSAVWFLGLVDYLFRGVIYLGIASLARALAKGWAFNQEVLSGARLFAWSVVLVGVQEIAFNTLASVVKVLGVTTAPVYFMVAQAQLVFFLLGATLVMFVAIFAKARLVAEDSASII